MPTSSVIWPFEPYANFSSQGQTKEWLTDVIPTQMREMRNNVRKPPRNILEYTYLFKDTDRKAFTLANLIAMNKAAVKVKIPFWQDVLYLGSITPGFSINLPATLYDYVEGGELIIWESPYAYSVHEIETIGETYINLVTEVTLAGSRLFVAPLVTGFCPEGIEISREGSKLTSTVRLVAQEAVITPKWDTVYFQGSPVLNFKRVQNTVTRKFYNEGFTFDSQAGLWEKFPLELYNRLEQSIKLLARSPEGIRELRNALDSLQGRLNTVWIPTNWPEVQILDGTLSAETRPRLSVAYFGGTDYPIKFCRLFGDDGTDPCVVYAEIFETALDGANEKIRFTEELQGPIYNIHRVEFMYPYRFVSDELSMRSFPGKASVFEGRMITANPIVEICNDECLFVNPCSLAFWGDASKTWLTSPALGFYVYDVVPAQRPANITMFIITMEISLNNPSIIEITKDWFYLKAKLKAGSHVYTFYLMDDTPLPSYQHGDWSFIITAPWLGLTVSLLSSTIISSIIAL